MTNDYASDAMIFISDFIYFHIFFIYIHSLRTCFIINEVQNIINMKINMKMYLLCSKMTLMTTVIEIKIYF